MPSGNRYVGALAPRVTKIRPHGRISVNIAKELRWAAVLAKFEQLADPQEMKRAFYLRQQLRPGDVGEITRMHGEFYSQEYGYGVAFEAYVAEGLAKFQHQFNAGRDRVWLYEHEGGLVATLFLMDRNGRAQLRFFLTHPDYRSLGLGNDLMAKFMDALAEIGYTHSFLWTTNHLAVAASLYTRNGFVLTEQKPSTRFGKPVVEMKYEWWAKT